MKINKLIPFLTMGAFVMLMTNACEKEVIKEVEVHDTTYVEYITIVGVNADFDSIGAGGTITLTVESSADPSVGELSYLWYSEEGTFSPTTGDTVTWTAPDEAGAYRVFVHAADYGSGADAEVGIGSALIGVGMYAPTVEPYYVGNTSQTCTMCHASKNTEYLTTHHSHAWEDLMSSDHASAYCFPCHTIGYGYAGVPGEPGDGGYDEAPIAKYTNVQCENCHGPGSFHIAGPAPTNIKRNYDASVCGNCHTGSHNPNFDEWQTSVHGNSLENHAAPISSCQGCHEGTGAAIRLSGDLSTYFNGGAIERPAGDTTLTAIGCATCHDPHSAENPDQIRTLADIPLVSANNISDNVISVGGKGKVCMQCHHARRSADTQLENGYAHFGPHGSPQADMLNATSAYTGVADAGFAWAAPTHLLIEDACVSCHMYSRGYNASLDPPAIKGHSFEPKEEACAKCHGEISDFDEIMARDDFDGNGTIEGLEVEVDGLMAMLEAALIADGLDTTGGESVAHALGDTARSTFIQREAGYNLVFLQSDGSHGFHNPDYAVQLLQQSYLHLTGSLPLNAQPLVAGQKATSPF